MKMGKVFEVARGQVVDTEDGVTVSEETVDKMRAEKSGGAGDEDAGFKMTSAPSCVTWLILDEGTRVTGFRCQVSV